MFPRHLLGEGEELVLDVRPHWRVLAGKAAEGALIIFVGNLLFSIPVPAFLEFLLQPLRVVILLATLVVLAWRMIPALWNWASTQYVLTSERLILRKGLIDRYAYARELHLSDVEDVQLRQSSWGRALGFGDLLVEARGAYRHTRFPQVPHPEMVQEEINHQIQALGHRPHPAVGQSPGQTQTPEARPMRVAQSGPPTAAQGAPAGTDVVGQLQHLAELRDRGVLDPEEFARLKRDLLGRL
jgi:Bacterial PH domain/Short C-terminal domain